MLSFSEKQNKAKHPKKKKKKKQNPNQTEKYSSVVDVSSNSLSEN
jgi:hypothetical protein